MQTKKPDRMPDALVRRLPAYYRQLTELEQEGVTGISSFKLAEHMGLTDSQIRHDLNSFGGFGRRGLGYPVATLKKSIGDIMDINREHPMIIIGAGRIGSAVAMYPGFKEAGFNVTALFDVSPELIGTQVGGAPVLDAQQLTEYLAQNDIEIAIIATPAAQAQQTLDTVAQAGVRGVWNFVPTPLIAPEGAVVINVHLTDSLMALSFRMHEVDVINQGLSWTE